MRTEYRRLHSDGIMEEIEKTTESSSELGQSFVREVGHGDYDHFNPIVSYPTKQIEYVCALRTVVESVDSVDPCRFMITSQNVELFWIQDFIGQQQTDRFDALFPPIDIIATE